MSDTDPRKSELALHLAVKTKEEQPETNVLWFSASNAGDVRRSIDSIGRTLGFIHQDGSLARFKEILLDPANGKWLIILDGFDSMMNSRLDEMDGLRLLRAIPVVHHVSTILTLRTGRDETKLSESVNTATVHPFSEAEAVLYLKLRLAEIETSDMVRLARELYGIPLALTRAAECMEESGMASGEYLELLHVGKAREAERAMKFGGRRAVYQTMAKFIQPSDAVDLTRRVAERVRTNMDSATARRTDPSSTAKDSGYGSYESGSIAKEDVEEQEETSDVQSVRTLSSFVDLGLDGRLRGINIFASDLAQSLSPDIPEVVEGRELVVLAVQDALRAYSYSLEQQNRPGKLSDERKAAHFVRQQSQ